MKQLPLVLIAILFVSCSRNPVESPEVQFNVPVMGFAVHRLENSVAIELDNSQLPAQAKQTDPTSATIIVHALMPDSMFIAAQFEDKITNGTNSIYVYYITFHPGMEDARISDVTASLTYR
jgi:hypothetical protein